MTGFNWLEEDVSSAQSDNKFVKLTINLFLLNFFFFFYQLDESSLCM
jgi:hypothetical protein